MCYFCVGFVAVSWTSILLYPLSLVFWIPAFHVARYVLGFWIGKKVYEQWKESVA